MLRSPELPAILRPPVKKTRQLGWSLHPARSRSLSFSDTACILNPAGLSPTSRRDILASKNKNRCTGKRESEEMGKSRLNMALLGVVVLMMMLLSACGSTPANNNNTSAQVSGGPGDRHWWT